MDQARQLGVSRGTRESNLRRGRWVAVAPGVYRLAGSPATWQQRALAACLAAGPGAVLSHDAAGAVLGLAGIRRPPVEVAVPPGRRPGAVRRLAVVHRPRRLEGIDVARVGPIPVTAPARTVIDQAGRLSVHGLASLVDDVLCRGLTSPAHLLRRVEALRSPGRSGLATLERVLEVWDAGPPAGSGAEMDLVRFLVARGFPMPVRQHPIVRQGRVVARVDLAWPPARLALELDSERWHGGGRAYHRDKARLLSIAAAGWEVLAVTPRNLADGAGEHLLAAIEVRLADEGR